MIFVSIVARSCRKPFQRWNLDRKGTLSGGIPSSTNDLRFHRGPIMSVAIPAVEPRPARYLVGGGFHRPRMIFVLSPLPPCAHVRIYTYIYIYILLAARSEKHTFSNLPKCCVFDISTRTFSDSYQLMETMFCVFFLFSLLFLPLPSTHCVHLHEVVKTRAPAPSPNSYNMLHGQGCQFGAGGTAGQGRQAASGAMSGG